VGIDSQESNFLCCCAGSTQGDWVDHPWLTVRNVLPPEPALSPRSDWTPIATTEDPTLSTTCHVGTSLHTVVGALGLQTQARSRTAMILTDMIALEYASRISDSPVEEKPRGNGSRAVPVSWRQSREASEGLPGTVRTGQVRQANFTNLTPGMLRTVAARDWLTAVGCANTTEHTKTFGHVCEFYLQ